ncbi:hypothetical protein C7212DRAFT_343020 [Tuber magnatum]|uniref:RCC1/BLIP-II protein n=1 Tax=Tuber magnatum TaxID=42249 RepID=A0A317SS55_9PEZI|nr:hypothetical protein C7212DRAFT_343020 [Tuber magnatum]
MGPRLNAYLHDKKVGIVAIAACGMHLSALSNEGMVYSWGVNHQSALGRVTGYTPTWGDGDLGSDSDSDKLLNTLGSRPVHILAFQDRTIAVPNRGRIYAWGTFPSSKGILELNKRIHNQPVPKLLDTPKDVVQVACHTDHILALTKRGGAYAWGNDRNGKVWSWHLNQYTQWGIDGGDTIRSPTQVISLTNFEIKQMSTGEHHTAALTDDGKLLHWGRVAVTDVILCLFTWGSDVGYQTSHGPHNGRGEAIPTPNQIENPATRGVSLVSLAASGQFSIIAGLPTMSLTDKVVP